MITFFIYRLSDGYILVYGQGSTVSVGVQSVDDTQGIAYGIPANPGQYYDVTTGTVQDTIPMQSDLIVSAPTGG